MEDTIGFFLEFQMGEQKKNIEICIELTDFPSECHIKVFLNVFNVRSRLTLLWTTSFQCYFQTTKNKRKAFHSHIMNYVFPNLRVYFVFLLQFTLTVFFYWCLIHFFFLYFSSLKNKKNLQYSNFKTRNIDNYISMYKIFTCLRILMTFLFIELCLTWKRSYYNFSTCKL